MRIPPLALVVGTVLATAPAAQQRDVDDAGRFTDSLQEAFDAGGRIRMDLSAGRYVITGVPQNRIGLEWSVRRERELSRVRADVEIDEGEATVRLDGPSNNFRAAIAVPSRADLRIRQSAGDLTLTGIEGSKDVRLNAGEIDIDVGRPDDYRLVDVSIWAGEINARPFGASRDGVFRSIDWQGNGPYDLRARLMAGEITLRTTGGSNP